MVSFILPPFLFLSLSLTLPLVLPPSLSLSLSLLFSLPLSPSLSLSLYLFFLCPTLSVFLSLLLSLSLPLLLLSLYQLIPSLHLSSNFLPVLLPCMLTKPSAQPNVMNSGLEMNSVIDLQNWQLIQFAFQGKSGKRIDLWNVEFKLIPFQIFFPNVEAIIL